MPLVLNAPQVICSFVGVAVDQARCFVWSTSGAPTAPSAGGDIDGVSFFHEQSTYALAGVPACPGVAVRVEASAAFNAGVALETTADGRVKAQSSGKAVLRALEAAAGAGSIVWAVFTSGR